MGSVIEIRQMMAEGKFPIAQFEIEASLKSAQGQEREDLLYLVLEFLNLEMRGLPVSIILEAATLAFEKSPETFHHSLPKLREQKRLTDLLAFQSLLIRDFEKRGRLAELHLALSEYQILCVENKIPFLDPRIQELSLKYFRKEFPLILQRITLALMQGNSKLVTEEITETLLGLQENRGRNQSAKLEALLEILGSFELSGELVLYRNFLRLKVHGIRDKRDQKSFLEFVIGIEDYRLLVLAMDLIHLDSTQKVIESFVRTLKAMPKFDFLYVEKNFPDLKKYFVNVMADESIGKTNHAPLVSESDLALEDVASQEIHWEDSAPIMEEEEVNLLKQIQYGDFSFEALCDLTVGFLQSDYLRAARSASSRAVALATSNEEKVRATYLRITVLMKLGDYRSALDSSLSAMDLVSTETDLLSLLYVQAECHERIGAPGEARKILLRILEIDADYRLAKERLEKINEA